MSSVKRVRNKQAETEGVPSVSLPQVSPDGDAAGGRAPGPREGRPAEVQAGPRPTTTEHTEATTR